MTRIVQAAAATKAEKLKDHGIRSSDALLGHLLALPATVFIILLFIVPTGAVILVSLTDWQLGAGSFHVVGFRNFIALASDPVFCAAASNTILYAAMVVPGSIVLGLVLALLIERAGRFQALYRAVQLLPYMASLSAMALVWEALLHPTIGLVNNVARMLALPPMSWLRDVTTVLPTLAAISIWQNAGFAMVLFAAGLKAIPRDLYDAAEIDGVDNWLDRFRTVTFPLLGPVAMFVVIVTAMKAFETFDTVQILTQGGPNKSSELLLYTLYTESFVFMRTGFGAAIAVVFLAVMIALTLTQARIMDRRVHYT